MRVHKVVWKSGLVQIALLIIFVLVVQLVVALLKWHPSGGGLAFWGVVFSLIPAFLWLTFFYQRDRLEPEPKGSVFGVFLLGALLAASIGIPLVKDVFRVSGWLYQTSWGYLLGSILVIGITEMYLVYAAVRHTVHPTSEFDEWIDGIVYATAAGLGYATVLNIHYAVELGGAKPVVAALYCVINALAYASFASIIGFALSAAKFRARARQPVLALGLLGAAVLNGLFFWVQRLVISRNADYRPWNGLIAAVVIAAAVYAIVEALMRRSVALEAARGSSAVPAGTAGAAPRRSWDYIVILLVIVCLLAGWVVKSRVEGRTASFSEPESGISFDYPANWLGLPEKGAIVAMTDPLSPGEPDATLVVKALPRSVTRDMMTLGIQVSSGRADTLTLYRMESMRPVSLNGAPGIRIDYAYATDPAGVSSGAAATPRVVRAADVVVTKGDRAYVFTFSAEADAYNAIRPAFEKVVASIRVQ